MKQFCNLLVLSVIGVLLGAQDGQCARYQAPTKGAPAQAAAALPPKVRTQSLSAGSHILWYPVAPILPLKTCAHVQYSTRTSHCGGYNTDGCNKHCGNARYPMSYCEPTYCLCHTGYDYGNACERI